MDHELSKEINIMFTDKESIDINAKYSPDEIHEKLLAAYREIMIEKSDVSVAGLSERAGVHWESSLLWLKSRSIDDTTELRLRMDHDWSTCEGAPPPCPKKTASDMEELVQQASQMASRNKRLTVDHVQSELRIGYNRAMLILEELKRLGHVL